MARIKISEVPAAPSVAGAAPLPINVPEVPGRNLPYTNANLPSIPQIDTGAGTSARFRDPQEISPSLLEAPLDIEGKTSQLMMRQMDTGPYAFLATQSMKAAEAIGTAGRSVGDALTDLAQGLQQSKDMADISRANNFTRIGLAAYEEEAAKVPITERGPLWENKYVPLIDGAIQASKPSAYAADRIGPDWQLAQIKQRTKINADARDEVMKNDQAAITEEINSAVARGDWGAASDANARLTLGRHQSMGQQNERQRQINDAHQEWQVTQDMNANPKMVLAEMEEAQATGKSDIYPNLTNPSVIARKKSEARTEVNRREIDASERVSDQIASGSIKLPNDIDAAAEGNISPTGIERLKHQLASVDPAYSSEKIMRARDLIGEYNPDNDKDLQQWHGLQQLIADTPKSEQPLLSGLLAARLKKEPSPSEPKQPYANSLLKRYEDLTELGVYDPKPERVATLMPGLYGALGIPSPFGAQKAPYDRDKAKKDPLYRLDPANRAIEEAAWVRGREAQESMRQWLMAHPEASASTAEAEFQKQSAAEARSYLQKETERRKPTVPTAPMALPPGAAKIPEVGAAPPSLPNYPALPTTRPVSAAPRISPMRVTAYVPGMGGIEGGPGVAARKGNAFTMEDYAAGRAPHVSVAMDEKSEWQGRYLVSESYPGVVFKVEDRGDAFTGKRESAVDIAFRDPTKATDYSKDAAFSVVDEKTARGMSDKVGAINEPAPIVATVQKIVNRGARRQMMEGVLNVGDNAYQYRSGGSGRGSLPPGEYIVTEHQYSRKTPGMVVGDVGFSFALSDKYDRRVGDTRTLLRIHPDGGAVGTAGCIGIVGGKQMQAQFRDDLSAAIRANGGKLRLSVG